ncbi:hypothetical protein COT44_01715 [Candidatus Shapirobacteria bacterium CG08_land_8_20_14_0_20_39_18]|uniref:Translation initiation factor IF-2 n=1 Tax=Candidatus Shapirobacteria bacterium CG08_land_8_20_14_0_20_39_18 TaxID=1974883 RepID=A0A2M6XDH2_9BACT|nr:MAG: hypothetical protein COT44_01715 [Candidatus Shapirobacteria bacterium CG08_land_8_20_14_0_20_39_18]PIY65213.1 MAG: hypothetical protein COY91_03295 [Candidatus Shapirobacteria bacterium CG_4_10_14_0_8_um_filter_39_15]
MAKKEDKQIGMLSRPPIVAVLGHVDHGKTSLLDKIRQTKIALKEAGGITQKIGAYQVEVGNQKITFIDTPGHQAFSAMRSRGAKVADIVILVVAADDGVMPQTMESIGHIQASGVPFIVAINKIDVPGADVDSVKKQLEQNGVGVEGYGGDVVCVSVSAKTGEGVKDLLEMILLVAEMHEIKADPNGPLFAVIIESKKDQRGAVGTVIVKNGTLHIGDQVNVAGTTIKVRGMFDAEGKPVSQAEPGKPVEVLGFVQMPPVGAELSSRVDLEKTAPVMAADSPPKIKETENQLRLIIKTDSQGSLEAIKATLPTDVFVILFGIGDVIESDVLLARTSQAEIWGFNIKASSEIEKLASSEKVIIKTFNIIYDFLENLEKRILTHLEPTIEDQILGKAEIIASFEINKQMIAGAKVLEGRINKADNLRLLRGEVIVGETRISSLKQQKAEVGEVQVGEEFGIRFSTPLDFKVGDMVISYRSK